MRSVQYNIILFICLIQIQSICAQSGASKIYVNYNATNKTHTIKWYLPEFIYQEPVILWAKYNNQEWRKLSPQSFSFSSQATTDLFTKEEKDAYNLCLSKTKLTGVALLQVLKQSFSSLVLCQKLGIAFQYKPANNAETVQYKITSEKTDKIYIESSTIRVDESYPKSTPIEFELKQNKKSVNLFWKAYPENLWGLFIQRKTNDSTGKIILNPFPLLQNALKTTSSVPEYVDKTVAEKTIYTYQLLGFNYFGDTIKCSKELRIQVTDVTAPPAIQTINKTVNKSSVTLQWQQNNTNDIRTFAVLRTTKSDTDYRELRHIPFNEGCIIYQDTVPDFQSYYYKIRSIDAEGNFAESAAIPIEVPDTEAPLPAFIKNCKADSNFISLVWENKITKDWAGCYLFRSINDTTSSYFVRINPEPIKQQSYTDTLPTNTKNRYFYKLISLDSSLNYSPFSNLATARLPDKTAPTAPFIALCTKSKNGISVNWFKNPEMDVMHYELTITDTINKENHVQTLLHKDSTHHNFDVKNLPAFFLISLRAIDSAGNRSAKSNQHEMFIGQEKQQKNPVVEFEAKGKINAENFSCVLTWKLNDFEQVRGFTVYRTEDNAKESYPVSGFIVGQKEYVDATIENQHLYRYHVRALLLDGQLIHTNTIEIKTYPHEKNKFRIRKK